MIKLGLLSFWHVHAADYARDAANHPDTEVVALWDEDAERGARVAAERGWQFYPQLGALLAAPELAGVIVTTPTSLHRDVMVAAAEAGKHIFTEKVLAATSADVDAIVAAVERAGVKLTISLPRLNDGYTQALQALVHAGELGTITQLHIRLAHNGALPNAQQPQGWLPAHFYNQSQALGGALIDLGCHPVYLARQLLGMPHSVQASFSYLTGREVEDQAVALLNYANGAVAIVETGFVNPGAPFMIEAHGTAGSALYGTPEPRLLVRRTAERRSGEWVEVPLPEQLPGAFTQWVGHIQHGTTAVENIGLARDLTQLMEAAYQSAASGALVRLG